METTEIPEGVIGSHNNQRKLSVLLSLKETWNENLKNSATKCHIG